MTGKHRADRRRTPVGSPTAGRYDWVDRKTVTVPHSPVVEVLAAHYWAVNEAGQVCLYRWGSHDRHVSPQCNHDRAVVEKLAPPGTVGIELIDYAFVPHRCER